MVRIVRITKKHSCSLLLGYLLFRGYPFETHYVPTTDKFILTLHRIPHSRTEELEQKNRPHFLSRSSSTDSTSSSASTSASSSPPPNNNTTTTINQQQQNGATTKRRRPVVLFWHGFLMCSEVWVCRPNPHSNLPMLLADLVSSRHRLPHSSHKSLNSSCNFFLIQGLRCLDG